MSKLYQLGELAAAIKQHKDLLFVTHDYFESVTSKTKLMEVTANLSGQVKFKKYREILYLLLLLNTIISAWLTLLELFNHLDKMLLKVILMLPLWEVIFKTLLSFWPICMVLNHLFNKNSSKFLNLSIPT